MKSLLAFIGRALLLLTVWPMLVMWGLDQMFGTPFSAPNRGSGSPPPLDNGINQPGQRRQQF